MKRWGGILFKIIQLGLFLNLGVSCSSLRRVPASLDSESLEIVHLKKIGNFYEVFSATPATSEKELKSLYRKLAMKFHPDRNQGNKTAEEAFKAIGTIWETLGNDQKRKIYDKKWTENFAHLKPKTKPKPKPTIIPTPKPTSVPTPKAKPTIKPTLAPVNNIKSQQMKKAYGANKATTPGQRINIRGSIQQEIEKVDPSGLTSNWYARNSLQWNDSMGRFNSILDQPAVHNQIQKLRDRGVSNKKIADILSQKDSIQFLFDQMNLGDKKIQAALITTLFVSLEKSKSCSMRAAQFHTSYRP